uniref:Sporulation protein Cse60 n=1 Tax=viral metagenome TaxID=1070528 RepID=A0A6M3XGS3_9ZZZZ
MKVKIFNESENEIELEKSINKFLNENKNITVERIWQTQSSTHLTTNVIVSIWYEEE